MMMTCIRSDCRVTLIRKIAVTVLLLLAVWASFALAETVAPYTGDIEYIANSTVSGINDAPANTVPHFELCASDASFATLKGDVRLTSDNRVVMCSDPGYTLNAEGKIAAYNASNYTKIRDMTYAQVMALRYADQYGGADVGVCDFETFVSICKEKNRRAYITLRNEYTAEIVDYILPVLEQNGMLDKSTISNVNYEILQYVRSRNASIRLSYVVSKSGFTTGAVDKAKQLGNCVVTLYDFPASRGGLNNYASYYGAIVYAQSNGIALNAAILNESILIDDLRAFGVSGIQFSVKPEQQAHAWGEPVYAWAADYKTLTASKTCLCGQNHKISETVPTTEKVIEEATYDKAGSAVYTSEAFKNPAFAAQETTAAIPAKNRIQYPTTIYDNGNYALNWTTGTASLKGLINKNVVAFTIPDAVVVEGQTFPVTEINASAFKSNTKLMYLAIGNNVTIIGSGACKGCTNLRAVYGGAGVEKIKAGAFYSCKRLRVFPRMDKLVAVGASAFRYCYYLREFFLGKRVNYIGRTAFFKCKRMKSLVIETMALTGSTVKAGAFKGTVKRATVLCPSQVLGYYVKLLPRKGISKKASIGALPYAVSLEAAAPAAQTATPGVNAEAAPATQPEAAQVKLEAGDGGAEAVAPAESAAVNGDSQTDATMSLEELEVVPDAPVSLEDADETPAAAPEDADETPAAAPEDADETPAAAPDDADETPAAAPDDVDETLAAVPEAPDAPDAPAEEAAPDLDGEQVVPDAQVVPGDAVDADAVATDEDADGGDNGLDAIYEAPAQEDVVIPVAEAADKPVEQDVPEEALTIAEDEG